MREMILADNERDRRKAALAKLLPYQREDFIGIFKAMNGLPVTIRLLDPPLHEFLPHDEQGPSRTLAKRPGHQRSSRCKRRVSAAARDQPDARPPRLPPGVTYPEILEMQVRAIIEAAMRVQEAEDQGAAGDHDPAGGHGEGARVPERDRPRRPTEQVMKEQEGVRQDSSILRHDDRSAPRRA